MAILHVDRYGSGTPLLLIHGWGMHGGMWGAIAEKLSANFDVFAVDLPGHGFNALPSPAGGITSDLAAAISQPSRMASSSIRGAGGEGSAVINEALTLTLSRLRERGSNHGFDLDYIVDQLSPQFSTPLTVCGWSLGGQIALRWAMRYPQQVSRLVLVASTPCFVRRPDWPCAMAAETLAAFAAAVQQDYASTLRRFLALQVRGSEQERELLATLRTTLFSRGEPDLAALQGGLEILRDCDLRDDLPGITQPALVIGGERDTLTPPLASQYLAEHLPDAELAIIKGAAHAPFLSHPDEFVMRLRQFMENRND